MSDVFNFLFVTFVVTELLDEEGRLARLDSDFSSSVLALKLKTRIPFYFQDIFTRRFDCAGIGERLLHHFDLQTAYVSPDIDHSQNTDYLLLHLLLLALHEYLHVNSSDHGFRKNHL